MIIRSREARVKRLSFLKKKNLGEVIVKNSAYVPIQMHESILKGLEMFKNGVISLKSEKGLKRGNQFKIEKSLLLIFIY